MPTVRTAVEATAYGALDTVIALLVEGDAQPPAALPEAVRELISAGEAKPASQALTTTYWEGKRYLLAGVGDGNHLERVRAAAGRAQRRGAELGAARVGLHLPEGLPHRREDLLQAAVEGVLLADYRFDRYKTSSLTESKLEELVVFGAAEESLAKAAQETATVVAAANRCRDLQNRPGNDLTPTALGEEMVTLAAQLEGVTAEFEGLAGITRRGMGAFAAVAQGSAQEPALITVRYNPPARRPGTPLLGLVGKAITFDAGGISLKPAAKMAEMKFDMSGGAAVLCALEAIARLRLPLAVVAVVGASENLPGGRAVKPGDIVRTASGKTVEINNTDAEGRLVLADCLHHALGLGAEVLIDLATLTGAVLVALGSTYAGLLSNDNHLKRRLVAAGERSGELLWELPLNEEYDELIKGRYADLNNAPEGRKAGTIVGGAFLSNFVQGRPWAHLDIAGTAWDRGRPYADKGGSAFGVRLLVELARALVTEGG